MNSKGNDTIKRIEKEIMFGQLNMIKYVDLYFSKCKCVEHISMKLYKNDKGNIREEIYNDDTDYRNFTNESDNLVYHESFDIKMFKDIVTKKRVLNINSLFEMDATLKDLYRHRECTLQKTILLKDVEDIFVRVIFTGTQSNPIIKVYNDSKAFESPLSLSEDDNSEGYLIYSSYGAVIDLTETVTQTSSISNVKQLTAYDIYLQSIENDKVKLTKRELKDEGYKPTNNEK